LEAVTDAVKARLDRREKAPPASKSASDDSRVSVKPVQQPPTPRFSRDGLRDPFLPYKTVQRNPVSRPRDNLSPLERFELGQLRVTGIIWDIPEPLAMVEDTVGFGYIIRVGTPIGVNDGKVKTIRRSEVVVEEFYRDVSGSKKKRDVSLRFSHD
jgi:type IV pilus assembly protein PilP